MAPEFKDKFAAFASRQKKPRWDCALSLVTIPTLQITNVAGHVQLSWPAAAAGFGLQKTAALSPTAVWTVVTDPVTTNGGQNVVTVTATNAAVFYRLQQ